MPDGGLILPGLRVQVGGTRELDPADDINRGLAGFWTFSDGGPVIRDLSLYSRRASATGGPTLVATPYGNGQRFNGSSQYATVPTSIAPLIDRTTPFSVWARVKFNSINASYDNAIVGKLQNSGSYPGWSFEIGKPSGLNGRLLLFMINSFGSNYIQCSGSTILATGVWYDVAVTFDGSSNANGVTFYIDAVPETLTIAANSLSSSIANSSALTFSARDSGAGNHSAMDVAAMRIWMRRVGRNALSRLRTDPWVGTIDPAARLFYAPRLLASSSRTGTLSATLDPATLSATSTVAISGTASATLAATTVVAAGTLALTGSTTATLDSATLAGTGTVSLSATLTATLGDASLSATGVSTSVVTGSLTATLDAATLSAASTLALRGTTTTTLADATVAGTGTLQLRATSSVTLAAATLSATGTNGNVVNKVVLVWNGVRI